MRSCFGSGFCIGLSAIVGCWLAVSVAVGEENQPPAATAQPPVLPETNVLGTQPRPSYFDESGLTGTILDGTVFSTQPVIGYRADSSTTGTIINVPDADLPATVNVIPRDVLNDQIDIRLTEAIRNAGGVVPLGDGFFPDRILLRGLEVGSRNYRKDGYFDPTLVPRDLQNVDRIEILKGPASVLYGSADPAGLVNLITKKPL